jgi:hypothetical protein
MTSGRNISEGTVSVRLFMTHETLHFNLQWLLYMPPALTMKSSGFCSHGVISVPNDPETCISLQNFNP